MFVNIPSPCMIFQSTPSARRATTADTGNKRTGGISIHALREEGDPGLRYFCAGEYGDFNPRPPRGGRRGHAYQSYVVDTISIHALREEGDSSSRTVTM